jgi:hypothetical protein
MSRDGGQVEVREDAADVTADCPLSPREQTRNILIFAANWSLIYLSSPVTYVGIVQATLVDRLGYGSQAANLPAAVYLWSAPLAVVVIWLFPQVRSLKALLVTAFLSTAVMGGVVAAAVLLLSAEAILAALVAHAVVWGCANGVSATCQWEMMGRGVSETRRGQALGLAFGAGPILAVIASIASQVVLGGNVPGFQLPFRLPSVGYPWNFAGLYLASVLVLALAALQSNLYVVPRPAVEITRQPFVSGVFGGFGEFLGSRLILFSALAYILVYSGHEILQNISLYTREALGESPEKYAGLQMTLRFGFKIGAGFFLGWLLTRTNPRLLLLTTTALCFASVLWALLIPGPWFLLSFGILGAGELFGVYYYNYILDCSPRSQVRRNMVFTALIALPVGFAPVLYGKIADTVGRVDRRLGFQVSFVVALVVLALTMLLVRLALPARPRPLLAGGEGEETRSTDRKTLNHLTGEAEGTTR